MQGNSPTSWSEYLVRSSSSSLTSSKYCRPTIDGETVCMFYNTMDMVFLQYTRHVCRECGRDYLPCSDERQQTIACRGQENVQCCFTRDEKEAITAICGTTAAGDTLPVWIVCKGTTRLCEKRFRESTHLRHHVDTGKLLITHSENGWVNTKIACDYVNWLYSGMGEECLLLWDVFSAHKNEEVQELARELGIGMGYIPVGLTSRHQPLDKRIFGSLKSRARARFQASCCC